MARVPALLAALFLLALPSLAGAVTVRVNPNAEECFHETARRGEKFLSSFNVASGGFLDINVKVTGPDGGVVYEEERQKEGTFAFVAMETGDYTLCFSNAMSTVTEKDVSFNVYVGTGLSSHGVAKEEHFTPLENAVVGLAEGLRKVRNEQKYIKFRERACFKTAQSTGSRVLWWSILQAVAVVAVGVWQTLYVRGLFDYK